MLFSLEILLQYSSVEEVVMSEFWDSIEALCYWPVLSLAISLPLALVSEVGRLGEGGGN